jgi:hypothetical protein
VRRMAAFWARRRLRGLRLQATDTTGPPAPGAELRGPNRVLLLLLTGRTMTVLDTCQGGVRTIIERSGTPCAEADQS